MSDLPQGDRMVAWPEDEEAQKRLLARAVSVLRSSGVVAFPTDTVYGIGVLGSDAGAIRRLYAIKGRPPEKAIALLVSDAGWISEVTGLQDQDLLAFAQRFWPGGLTVVIRWRRESAAARAQPFDTVGVRVPDHRVALQLIAQAGEPLATTSANLSGLPSALTAQQVWEQLGDRVDLIIDGGRCPGGQDSTVLDMTTRPPSILRQGELSREDIEAVVGPVSLNNA